MFREHARVAPSVTTQVGTFAAARADLLIAEAMVTSDGKPEAVDGFQDHADAVAAANRFEEILASGSIEPDVTCAPHRAFNLAAGQAVVSTGVVQRDYEPSLVVTGAPL